VNEADVVVRQRGFNLEMATLRDHDCEHLGRRDDAAFRFGRRRRRGRRDPGFVRRVGFDLIPGDACGLLFGFRQFVVQRARNSAAVPVARLLDCGRRCLGFLPAIC
jgi:hypothetical protein